MSYYKFIMYETIRKTGKTNMLDIDKVLDLIDTYFPQTKITDKDISEIQSNYNKYSEMYKEKSEKEVNRLVNMIKNEEVDVNMCFKLKMELKNNKVY